MRIGITSGDINGIGPEVILKALSNNTLIKGHEIVIYGSGKVLAYHKNIVKGIDIQFSNISDAARVQKDRICVVNCWNEDINITLGKATAEAGRFAHVALDRAVNDLKNNSIDVLVTAPINKHTMDSHSFPFAGHTEYLGDAFQVKDNLMTMVSDNLRIALVTNHEPIIQIPNIFSKELLEKKIKTFNNSLKTDFAIEKPVIAVLGMNPHAGDNGKIGAEEDDIIRPTIIEFKKQGIMVSGPHSADGFFGSGSFSKVDGILAMYHDQGLIPFKTLTFGRGVNYTAGMPYVRTSPDHGTAYDLAGENLADASSMRNAIFAAIDIYNNRKLEKDLLAHKVESAEKPAVEA